MTTPLARRRSLVGAAVESTSGTPETVSTALSNTIVYDAKMVPTGVFDDGERRPNGHYGGSIDTVAGKLVGSVTFTTEVRYGDATLTLLKGCGFTVSTGNVASGTASG